MPWTAWRRLGHQRTYATTMRARATTAIRTGLETTNFSFRLGRRRG
jgi:hypothetical protein